VYQHHVFLTFFFVPSHQLSMLFISKQTLQMWYYRRVPHDLSRNSLPRVLSPDLLSQCTAYGTCIQINVILNTKQ
jgi:hypothetical protein